MVDTDAFWAANLGQCGEFADARHQKRFTLMMGAKASSPNDSIPQFSGGPVATKASYDFLNNREVKISMIENVFATSTANSCVQESVVLVVHDTTTGNFTGCKTIEELGPIDSGFLAKGVHIHSSLILNSDGVVMGIGAQQIWTRPPYVPGKKVQKEEETKESHKWILGIEAVHESMWEAVHRNDLRAVPRQIDIADRESDCYEVLQTLDDLGRSGVIRSVQNRSVDSPLRLAHDAVRGQSVMGRVELQVPRKGQHPERSATVEVRVLKTILRPDTEGHPNAWAMAWTLVEVYEPNPPEGIAGLHWLLWTREPADTLEEALRVVTLYKYRWKIEEFHYALKSGCNMEELRLRDFEALEKAIRMFSGVAARIVQLRDTARSDPDGPATRILTEEECEVLQLKFSKHADPFRVPLTISQAVLWVGRLGGHLNRKGDGMPGVRTLWRGLHDLAVLVDSYRVAKAAEKRRLSLEKPLEKRKR